MGIVSPQFPCHLFFESTLKPWSIELSIKQTDPHNISFFPNPSRIVSEKNRKTTAPRRSDMFALYSIKPITGILESLWQLLLRICCNFIIWRSIYNIMVITCRLNESLMDRWLWAMLGVCARSRLWFSKVFGCKRLFSELLLSGLVSFYFFFYMSLFDSSR